MCICKLVVFFVFFLKVSHYQVGNLYKGVTSAHLLPETRNCSRYIAKCPPWNTIQGDLKRGSTEDVLPTNECCCYLVGKREGESGDEGLKGPNQQNSKNLLNFQHIVKSNLIF